MRETHQVEQDCADKLRTQVLDTMPGWFMGIRLDSVCCIKPDGYSIRVHTGWNGCTMEHVINIDFDEYEHDVVKRTEKMLKARNALALRFMGQNPIEEGNNNERL